MSSRGARPAPVGGRCRAKARGTSARRPERRRPRRARGPPRERPLRRSRRTTRSMCLRPTPSSLAIGGPSGRGLPGPASSAPARCSIRSSSAGPGSCCRPGSRRSSSSAAQVPRMDRPRSSSRRSVNHRDQGFASQGRSSSAHPRRRRSSPPPSHPRARR